jgi:hypothetical protein
MLVNADNRPGTPHRGWRNSHGYTYYTHATPPKQLEKPITGRASSSDSNTSAPVIVTPPTPTEKSTGISHDCTTLPAIAGVLASNLSNCVGTDVDRMGFTAVQNSSTEQPECSSLTPDVTSSSFDTTIELNQIEAVQDSPKLSPSISSSNERLITPNKNEEIVSNSSDQTEDQLLAKMEGLTQQLQEETRRRKWDPLHTAESSFLAKLSRDFSQVCDEYEILSVFAVKASRFTKSTVGKFSALLDMHNETVQGLDVKHEDLVRYDNEEDRIYSELQDAICKFTSRVKLRSIRSQEETTQENRTVQTNQMPSGFRRSMTMRPIRRKSSMAPEGGNVDAIESAKENQQIKNLVERFFPVGVNFPAETVDVTLGWSEQGVYFHDFEPKHHSLHLLAPEMFVTEQKEAESYDNSEFDADHTTLKGGFFWVHVPGNDRAWAQVCVQSILTSSVFN